MPFQVREGIDQVGRLESPVATAQIRLPQDTRALEARDRFVDRLLTPADQRGAALHS